MSDLMPWHKSWLVDIEYDRVDLVKEGANSQAFIKLMKTKGGTPMTLVEILKSLKPEHSDVIQKALDEAQTSVTNAQKAAEEAVAKAKEAGIDPAAGTSEEEILKSVKDPAVRALLETSILKTKAAEEVAKKLQEDAAGRDAIVKAKEVPNLGAEEAQLAEVYKKLTAVDSALCDDVFGIFKAASALIKEGRPFEEVGKGSGSNDGSLDENAAWGKIDAAAEEIAKSRNINKSAAIKVVMQEQPALYDAYRRAQD